MHSSESFPPIQSNNVSNEYRGRFAPSPSGALHFGSLVAAVGGYLQAKTQQGKWLLRIDDIDPPRQDPEAIDLIQRSLEAHHLFWDESIIFQSQQSQVYDDVIEWLQQQGLSYYCQCTRKQIHAEGGVYLGHCRELNLGSHDHSMRFRNDAESFEFTDALLGHISFPKNIAGEDFIIKRKDGLYAYHLASVVDDIQFGITEVVRGADLLYPSACQLALFEALHAKPPNMLHLPVAVFSPGRKLSKQGHAQPLRDKLASENLYLALAFLGLPVPATIMHDTPENILRWGAENWRVGSLYAKPEREMASFLSQFNCDHFSY
ncbi:tRNA glutamyl-Q(34) synthetase GluQRS [Paraneptunicella aestuarii]|uniref:tRNA glutamyl-Q(34) synthetase GluQRS n=1 Tax=Paraneptunicella aestuarii TaxID=2831148 RepID=UPI001E36FD64|nr:tRNA glutamyl-Q(34) synthetase GluQRS [Paraneptunicella aestuarii]UAA38521.1 tRNA glutamyl-Q(34) synthetase GluQRS [Paraneptunicella aestuarii]